MSSSVSLLGDGAGALVSSPSLIAAPPARRLCASRTHGKRLGQSGASRPIQTCHQTIPILHDAGCWRNLRSSGGSAWTSTGCAISSAWGARSISPARRKSATSPNRPSAAASGRWKTGSACRSSTGRTYPVELSEAGRQFLPVAQQTVADLTDTRQAIRERARGHATFQRIAALHAISVNFLQPRMAEFERQYPDAHAGDVRQPERVLPASERGGVRIPALLPASGRGPDPRRDPVQAPRHLRGAAHPGGAARGGGAAWLGAAGDRRARGAVSELRSQHVPRHRGRSDHRQPPPRAQTSATWMRWPRRSSGARWRGRGSPGCRNFPSGRNWRMARWCAWAGATGPRRKLRMAGVSL